MAIHISINQTQHRGTVLIKTNMLLLSAKPGHHLTLGQLLAYYYYC